MPFLTKFLIVFGVLAALTLFSGIRFIPNNRLGIVEKRFGRRSLKSGFIAQHGDHEARAMGRWVGVVGPNGTFDVALRRFCGLRGRCDHRQCADALTVEAEVFRETRCDQHFAAGRREAAHSGGIFVKPVAQALVVEVEKGKPPGLAAEVADVSDPKDDDVQDVQEHNIPAAEIRYRNRRRA